MTTKLLTKGIWTQITKTVRASRKPCLAAVAYFSAGASRRLPLPKGSRLVVDASDRKVKSGQTSPADLLKLLNRGVKIYSVPNLHAKVFVIGKTAYVGSTNVSKTSANALVEAVIRTTEASVVEAARKFVDENCLHELGPELLKRLAKLYRPPHIPGGGKSKGKAKDSSSRATLPPVHLVQLNLEEWSERDQKMHDQGLEVAKKRREHPLGFELDSFRLVGKCKYQRHDVIIQVTDEGSGRVLVTPQGNVLDVRTRLDGKRRVSLVYLERPSRPRRHVKKVARSLGCTQKRLRRDERIRDPLFRRDLLRIWAAAS